MTETTISLRFAVVVSSVKILVISQHHGHIYKLLCYTNLQWMTPFDEQYTCIIPIKLCDYFQTMLHAFVD